MPEYILQFATWSVQGWMFTLFILINVLFMFLKISPLIIPDPDVIVTLFLLSTWLRTKILLSTLLIFLCCTFPFPLLYFFQHSYFIVSFTLYRKNCYVIHRSWTVYPSFLVVFVWNSDMPFNCSISSTIFMPLRQSNDFGLFQLLHFPCYCESFHWMSFVNWNNDLLFQNSFCILQPEG